MGNVRSDARAKGQHTRLQARAIVLERGDTKVALVVTELCCVAGGLLTEAAKQLEGRGIDEQSMVVAGTHTHSAPGQYFPFAAYDITFPNVSTASQFSVQPDPQLYAFLARRIATAIERADDDLGPGRRRVGAHRDPRGPHREPLHRGTPRQLRDRPGAGGGERRGEPDGAASTIDPALDVLRVDKLLGGRLVPVGMWSTFANHGTVTLGSRAESYNGDHLGAAMLATEDALRRTGGAPRGQDVVTAFSNADEGDTSLRAGPHRAGGGGVRRTRRGGRDAAGVGRCRRPSPPRRSWTCAGPASASAGRRPTAAGSTTRPSRACRC